MKTIVNLDEARKEIQQGSVLAYPTEAVYGLGCDPFNEYAVHRILELKQRSIIQGMIVIISNWSQLWPLIDAVSPAALKAVEATWPGPTTWIFPRSPLVPDWVSGKYPSIAIRMTAHPIAAQLCATMPVVSTSANLHGQEPARDVIELQSQFPMGIDGIVAGSLGHATKPSAIYDLLSGACLR